MNYYDFMGQFFIGTKNPTLAHIEFFMERLDNPHKKFKSVHVAGTNGKGSVVETLYAVMKSAGYKTGKFISPYLTKFNEYITVGDDLIADNEIEEHLAILKPLIQELQNAGGNPTYWDILVTMTYMHFAKHRVDIAIVEVGMGGIWDATNVITPLVSVITKIDFDHKEHLGHTIVEIAGNKAGIIKQGVPCITCNYSTALRVIEDRAREMETTVTRVMSKDVEVRGFTVGQKMKIAYRNRDYTVSLRGRFQGVNIAMALEAIDILRTRGYTITDEMLNHGLENINHPARFEILSKKPLVIFDGAHNADSVRVFMEMLRDYFPRRDQKRVFIISMLKKKDADEAMEVIAKHLPRGTAIYFTDGCNSDEFHTADTLQKSYMKFDGKQDEKTAGTTTRRTHSTTHQSTFDAAIETALQTAVSPNVAVFVVGSFKTYTRAKELICQR